MKRMEWMAVVVMTACGSDEPLGPSQMISDVSTTEQDAAEPESACTSDRYWTGGDNKSPQMHPGVACNECHVKPAEDGGTRVRGPRFAAAGTVFSSLHEPDDCYGGVQDGADPVEIEVTGADGQVVRARANQVGNFFAAGKLVMPITARVLYQGRVGAMLKPVDSVDCNSCHSEHGSDGAPGRIVLP